MSPEQYDSDRQADDELCRWLKRGYFHESRIGHNWAKVSVEWSEHPDTPEAWKAAAEAAADEAFAAADKAREVVLKMSGR